MCSNTCRVRFLVGWCLYPRVGAQFVSMRKAALEHDASHSAAASATSAPAAAGAAAKAAAPSAKPAPPSPAGTLPPPTSSSVLMRTLEAGIKDERKDLLEVLTAAFWRKGAAAGARAAAQRHGGAAAAALRPSAPGSSSSSSGSSSGAPEEDALARAMDISAAEAAAATASGASSSAASFAGGTAAGTAAAAMACATNHGEHASIALGIYENFASVAYRDPWMVKTAELLDWLAWQVGKANVMFELHCRVCTLSKFDRSAPTKLASSRHWLQTLTRILHAHRSSATVTPPSLARPPF